MNNNEKSFMEKELFKDYIKEYDAIPVIIEKYKAVLPEEFDGGLGNRWWEAKSGQYWDMLEKNPSKMTKFKSDMGDRLRIAEQNGASYELFSNTPIPDSVKTWLTKKGIVFTEILD